MKICEQIFQTALLLFEENTCAKLFCNPCINLRSYGPDKLNL